MLTCSQHLFVALPTLCHAPSLAEHQTWEFFRGCLWLLQFAVLCNTWLCFARENYAGSSLAFSLIWYLVPALQTSQYLKNHLMKTINSYTFSLWEPICGRNEECHLPLLLWKDAVCLVTVALQTLQHPPIIRMPMLVCLKNVFLLVFPKINCLFRNFTQGYGLTQC